MLAQELLSQVHVDPANAGCYATVPPVGSCSYVAALQSYKDWELKVNKALTTSVSAPAVSSVLNTSTNQLTVKISWTNKGSTDTHSHTAITDVRS